VFEAVAISFAKLAPEMNTSSEKHAMDRTNGRIYSISSVA
jgi:hypothetical protein